MASCVADTYGNVARVAWRGIRHDRRYPAPFDYRADNVSSAACVTGP